jgi:tetratricopeptide (TPR) repeat protein
MAMTPARTRPVLVALLISSTAICYVHGHYTAPIFDDQALILTNESIRRPDAVPSLLGLGEGRLPAHRALRTITYALDYQVWGDNLKGYHVTNVLLHLLNVLLVLTLGRMLLAPGPWALGAAFVWAVHPVHTECVTYLSGRRDVLSAFFYLWGFYLYLRWRCGIGSGWNLPGCLAAYVAGCFSKELAVTLPGVIVGYEVVRALRTYRGAAGDTTGTAGRIRSVLASAPAFFVALGLFPVVFTAYVVLYHPYNVQRLAHAPIEPTMPTDVLTLAKVGIRYLGLLVFPRDLSIDYYPESITLSTGLAEPATAAALALHAALAGVVAWSCRRGSIAGFAGVWFIVTFLPMSNLFIVSNEPVAEHYLYLPSVGFWWAIGHAAFLVCRRWPGTRPVVGAAVAVAVLALGLRTDARNRDWEDPEQLYRASLRVVPRNSRLWNNLGWELLNRNRPEQALEALDRGLEIFPEASLLRYNRGYTLRMMGRLEEARREYELALRHEPWYVDALMGLGFTELCLRRYDTALSTYRRALKVPSAAVKEWYVHYWIGATESRKGDLAAARRSLEAAMQKGGERHPEILWQLALVAAAEARRAGAASNGGRQAAALVDEADALLVEAIAILPDSALLHKARGDLYMESWRPDRAVAAYTLMARNEEYVAESFRHIAHVYRRLGDRHRARTAYARVKELGLSDPALEGYVAGR